MIDPYDDDEEQESIEPEFVILCIMYMLAIVFGVLLCGMTDDPVSAVVLVVLNIPMLNYMWEKLIR